MLLLWHHGYEDLISAYRLNTLYTAKTSVLARGGARRGADDRMEPSKDQARTRFKQQRRNDRTHRRGQHPAAGGGPRPAAQRPELESNADR